MALIDPPPPEKVSKAVRRSLRNVQRIKGLEERLTAIEEEIKGMKRWVVSILMPILAAAIKFLTGIDVGGPSP